MRLFMKIFDTREIPDMIVFVINFIMAVSTIMINWIYFDKIIFTIIFTERILLKYLKF